MDWNKINEYLQIAIDVAVFYLPRIVLAGVIFWIGLKVAQKMVELVKKALERTGFSETLRPFFHKVQEILFRALDDVPNILQDPKPEIGILSFDSHNVQLTARPYVRPDDFWDVTFNSNVAIKKAFYKHDIKVAYSEGVEIGSIGA